MSIESFLLEIRSRISKINSTELIGRYTYLGINDEIGFGSPGGRWSPSEYPAFEFHKDEKNFLLRIIPERSKIVIEAVHLKNMLINYTLNDENFIERDGRVKLIDNFVMTVSHRRSSEEVELALKDAGMTSEVIFDQASDDLNLDSILDSLFSWADYREQAKATLRMQQKTTVKKSEKLSSVFSSATKRHQLNQILYGPPGTGKTYNTINKALEIIGEDIRDKSRQQIKEIYDAKVIDGQIVFTTFHQSMSYEDFVEGIKPVKPLPGDSFVKYDITPGIFFSICEAARSNYLNATARNKYKVDFEFAFERFKEDWENKPNMKFALKTQGYEFKILGFTNTSIQFEKSSGTSNHTLSIGTLREIYYGRDFDFKQGLGIYYNAVFKELEKYRETVSVEVLLKNYVLIIDEINRGNIASIFGELITLIEEEKRLTREESLEVLLPYSKTKFGVPPNLYIIGTMNTADRSVEALDTALRRRFAFEEMLPKPELLSPQRLIWDLWWRFPDSQWDDEPYATEQQELWNLLGLEGDIDPDQTIWNQMEAESKDESQISYFDHISINGVSLEKLLYAMNRRIEKLLDRDHQVGHSYFMGVNSIGKLKSVFQLKVVPLLQEYFFSDYTKIGLVIGSAFFSTNEALSLTDFAPFFNNEYADDESREIYRLRRIDEMTDAEFMEAIKVMMRA